MSNSSSASPTSRAEELLREAIELEAEELYLQTEEERVKVRYRVAGRIVQKMNGFLSDADNVIEQLKALSALEISADGNEGLGAFSFSGGERSVWIRVYWFREEDTDAVVVSILENRLGFEDLGLSEHDAATLDELISAPQGIVIGCGADGGGHATTLSALLERLAQNGKRVVSLGALPDTRLENVTHLNIEDEEWSEQIELLTGHFDVFAVGHLDSPLKVRAAFDLAQEGHLVLGLIYSFPAYTAMSRFLHEGISPEAIQDHFLGGWSQRLVDRADQKGQMGLFYCVGREEARRQFVMLQEADYQALDEEEEVALWRDAQEKISAGLIAREEVERRLGPPL